MINFNNWQERDYEKLHESDKWFDLPTEEEIESRETFIEQQLDLYMERFLEEK